MDKKENHKHLSRRHFIKCTALGVGALSVNGFSAEKSAAGELVETPEKWDKDADVIIIGAGGTGLVAAIEARQNGASVMVFEKASSIGGTTGYSQAAIQAAATDVQREAGLESDTTDAHFRYMMQAGEGIPDQDLVRVLADNAPGNIKWLESLGLRYGSVETVDPIPYIEPGLMLPRIHILKGSEKGMKRIRAGKTYVNFLYDVAKKKGIQFSLKSPVTSLVRNKENRISGIRAVVDGNPISVRAIKGVILAGGGYDRNKEMSRSFSPQQLWALDTGICVCNPANQGDAIKMAMSVGADLTGMGGTIGVPSLNIGIAPLVMGKTPVPGIWVNSYGRRFVNEATHYSYVMRSVFQQEGHIAWAIFDETVRKLGGKALSVGLRPFSHDLEKEIQEGKIKRGADLNELAERIAVNPDELLSAIKKWNKDGAKGEDTLFKRKTGLEPLVSPPYYATRVTELNLGTCGGLKINTNAEVLDVNGNVIPGLYAGGMAAGGIIGPYYPGSGVAIAGTVCFGRIAGANASRQASAKAV